MHQRRHSVILKALIIGGFLGTIAVGQAQAQDFDFKKLKFMSGCWAAPFGDKDQAVEENWSSMSDNLLLATTRYLTKKEATSYEFTRIERSDSGIAYISIGADGNSNRYTLTQLSDEFAVWENRVQDFPQRIMYRLASDGALIARNDKIEEYDPRNVEVRLLSVECPGKKR